GTRLATQRLTFATKGSQAKWRRRSGSHPGGHGSARAIRRQCRRGLGTYSRPRFHRVLWVCGFLADSIRRQRAKIKLRSFLPVIFSPPSLLLLCVLCVLCVKNPFHHLWPPSPCSSSASCPALPPTASTLPLLAFPARRRK